MGVLALLLAAGTYGLNLIDTADLAASITSGGVLPYLLAVPVLLVLFTFIERGAQDPIIRLSLFASKQVTLALVFAAGAGLGEAVIVFVPKLLTSTFHVSESTASFMLLPLVFGMVVGSPLAGRTLDRAGSRVVLLAGNVLLVAGMLTWGLLAGDIVFFYAGSVLVGLALGILLGAPLRYIMLGEAGAAERASAQGALTLFTSSGQLVGAALMGALIASRSDSLTGYEEAFLVVGVLAVGLSLLTFSLKKRSAELATQRAKRKPAGSTTV
jgi:MFS family permease